MKKLSSELFKMPFADQVWAESILSEKERFQGFGQKVVTAKSPKLYDNVREKVCEVRSNSQGEGYKEEVVRVDKKWRERQRRLGRNWMWRNFDNLHALGKEIVMNDVCFLEDVFEKDFLEKMFGSDYRDFKRSVEVRGAVNVIMLQIFRKKLEVFCKVSS